MAAASVIVMLVLVGLIALGALAVVVLLVVRTGRVTFEERPLPAPTQTPEDRHAL